MNIAIGQKEGAALVQALGLPKYTKEAEVRFAADAAVSVKCVYHPDDTKVRKLIRFLETSYRLVPRINWDTWTQQLEFSADGTRRLT